MQVERRVHGDPMSQAMDQTNEDAVSLKSGAALPGVLQTLRRSIRRAAEKSPLASGGKGSKVTTSEASDLDSGPPPSPSLSVGSPVTSPLKNVGGLFSRIEEDENDQDPPKGKGLMRSKTDPNMSGFGDSLLKKGASIRRSLKFGNKKDKACKEALGSVIEGPAEERKEQKEEEEEEEVCEEMEEAYTLPELPHPPLSVMQINKLIETEELEEAHLNLLALRQEFQREQERCGEDFSMEMSKKEKDLNLLYGELRKKLNTIVRDSNSLPSRNKALLVPVARIIQEEEKRAAEPGGLAGSWMEAWREAVGEGVRLKVASVHLEQREQSVSWLAVHLGLLGKAILEDLQGVKRELRWSYPPSFQVFSTYVRSYHRVAGRHVETLGGQTTELKDLHALLDWIIHRYKSERIMGSLSLQPEMRGESAQLQLEDKVLTQLRDRFCCKVKEDLRSSLDRVIGLEYEEVWRDSRSPEKEDDLLNASFHMDIWTTVKGSVKNSGLIDAQLERSVVSCCLLELSEFPKRFEVEFQRHCSALPKPLWTEYLITYINSFSALQQHMDGYRDACPDRLDGFSREAAGLVGRLTQALEDQFKDDVKPFLRRMMTRKWLTNDEDFKHLHDRLELLSEHCAVMRPPHNQHLVGRLHLHVVREYVGQLMKNNYSCKNRKHEKAATKMRLQWRKLSELFENMKSTLDWLYAVGDDLSDVLGQKNQTDIKNHLQPLQEHYPDFSRKHLVAVLSFRGLLRGRERQLILQRHAELKEKVGVAGGRSRVLFGDMPVTVQTDCLSNLPTSCLRALLPNH